MSATMTPILEIKNATKIYGRGRGEVTVALQDFNLVIPENPASITTIAGESGSGKTTLANAVLGFTGLTSGQILYKGMDIANLKGDQKLEYRREVQAVFQDPYEVYNPFYRVRHIFDMVISRFKLASNPRQAREMIEAALRVVGLRGEEVLEKYPHQLSGGQRQRMMIARAYLLKPKLIVADEPVSMVDASLRAMILDIMLRLRDEINVSFLYITHDLSTAYQIGDRIYILYQGSIAEKGQAVNVIENPKHPYVQLLIESIPVPDPDEKWDTNVTLPTEEELRSKVNSGCRFYPRCRYHMDRCLESQPPLFAVDGKDHTAACFLYDGSQQPETVSEIETTQGS
jgi:peptide/nickel transport system ATP-binding protein